MPDISTNFSAPSSTSGSAPGKAAGDPLAKLHKMSTTAGVSSAQYVAINSLSIAALLFGLASALSLVGSVLLILPAAGIVFAVASLRQIRNSNGTQTGKGLAIIGMILCIVMGAVVLGMRMAEVARVRAQTDEIATVISDLGKDLQTGQTQQAYSLFTPEFRSSLPLQQFVGVWKFYQQPDMLGKVHSIRWNGIAPRFTAVGGGKVPMTEVDALIDSDTHTEDRFQVTLRKIDGKWQIHEMTPFFIMNSR